MNCRICKKTTKQTNSICNVCKAATDYLRIMEDHELRHKVNKKMLRKEMEQRMNVR